MSQPSDDNGVELHLLSPRADDGLVELLTVIAHYHRTEAQLDAGHTVNFGRPWLPRSRCSYGLISLPYLDGPSLEYLQVDDSRQIRFLWLIPITFEERAFKIRHGLDALESRFESLEFDYANPERLGVV
jgi:hypothetical protein